MKYSFIIFSKIEKVAQIENKIFQFYNDAELFFVVNKKLKKNQHKSNILFFKEKSEDKILNYLINKINNNNLFVIRNNFNFELLEKLTMLSKACENGADIAIFRNNKSPLKNKIINFINYLNYKVFNFKFYNGNENIVLFSKNAVTILKEISAPSLHTKINNWIGFKIESIEINEILNPVKLNKKITPTLIPFLVSSILFVGLVVLLSLSLFKLFYIKILLSFFLLFTFSFSIIKLWQLLIVLKIGNAEKQIADEIKE